MFAFQELLKICLFDIPPYKNFMLFHFQGINLNCKYFISSIRAFPFCRVLISKSQSYSDGNNFKIKLKKKKKKDMLYLLK